MAYTHWVTFRSNTSGSGTVTESPLYSDALLVDRWTPIDSPYHVIPMGGYGIRAEDSPVAVLRVAQVAHPSRDLHAILNDMQKLPPSSEEHRSHHGGTLNDEVVALVSLVLDVRLKAGQQWRSFPPQGDPLGEPERCGQPLRVVMSAQVNRMLPRAVGRRSLSQLQFLSTLPTLNAADANALVISARLYQEAIWSAELNSQSAWLLLVSAAESTANRWNSQEVSSIERMRTSRPELEQLLLEAGGEQFVNRVADQLAPYMGATAKFRDFLLSFLPDPPTPRDNSNSIPWERKYLKKALEQIYSYRSRALHGGIAFPPTLCEPPKGFAERPTPGWRHSGGLTWDASDAPMFLHVFAHIVRGALLAWWEMLSGQPRALLPLVKPTYH